MFVSGLFLTLPVLLSLEAKEGGQIFPLRMSRDGQGWACAPAAARYGDIEP